MSYPDLNFKPRQYVLSEDQLEQIHMATLEIMERIGVKTTNPKALEVLDGAGARVNGDRVRIPAWMVKDALQKAPSRVVLGKRNGEDTVFLEGDKSWFGPSLDCVDFLDPMTNERRPFISGDCRITASVADALPNYTWVMTIGMAADAPADIADRVIAKQVMTYCEKPYVFCCKDVNSVRDIYEMAVLIAGSEERFQQAPTIAQFTQPIAPLVHSDSTIDKLIYCAEKSIPLVYYSAGMTGGTAPMTFAGLLVQVSAESLTGLVLHQLIRPGAPIIYGAFTTIMDMGTTIFSYGAPEMSLMAAAMAQMAQYYKLPFFGTAGCSDAKFPDPQAAAEAAFSCLSSALIGANLIHDPGWLDHGSLASPAYIVLVHEVLCMVKHYMRGIPVNDETLALDMIEHVGPGGHFLDEDHTMNHFRNIWYPELFDRTIYPQWLENGAKQFEQRLQEQTKKVMEHKPAPLPPEVIKEIDRMAEHWK